MGSHTPPSLRQRNCVPPLRAFSLRFYLRSTWLNRFYACAKPSLWGIAQSEVRNCSSLPHRFAVACLFEQDMRKFSDFDYKNARNDWNHAEMTFIAQISRLDTCDALSGQRAVYWVGSVPCNKWASLTGPLFPLSPPLNGIDVLRCKPMTPLQATRYSKFHAFQREPIHCDVDHRCGRRDR